MADKLPYVFASGVIPKTLEKIKSASTPERFTQDFLATKLGIRGGSAKAVIPFLKRVGFLGTDGGPTDLYKQFRNPSHSGAAAAKALKAGYAQLYEMNEYAHDLSDKDLKGLIVQATGAETESSTVRAIFGSFKALKGFAAFDGEEPDETESPADEEAGPDEDVGEVKTKKEDRKAKDGDHAALKMGLSYTINLNLPATSDIAVFNAIFKSLRENLLR